MKIFELKTQLWLPAPRERVFAFFADAGNLEILTPPWLNFEILTPRPIPMHPGALIDYRIRLRGLPLRWRTEIAEWQPPERFVDRQLRGPYRQWVHEHRFVERDGGTDCLDVVRYAVLGGALVDRLFVRRDVEKIFAYRREKMQELFGAAGKASGPQPVCK